MKRSTIFAWVQRCPGCGYCAADISEAPSQAAHMVDSPEYRRQLSDSTYPELANSFLCKAIIDESSGDYSAAAWALIHAAWACDDGAEKSGAGRTCRSKAADMIEKALGNGQDIAKQGGADTAIHVDLLRRAGRFTEARQLISTKRSAITDDISKILDFQDVLLTKGDDAYHTIAEALGEGE